ncbi:MAG: RNAase [Flavobacterium sp.]|nr:RNAase [Flavobacterium sp.]
MNEILNKNLFLIKEKIGIFKASNNYDVFDPENNKNILICREPNLSFFTKLFRFTDYKRMTQFNVVISTPEGKPIISVKRGFTIFRSDVEVFDENEKLIGFFKQQLLSFGGKFQILDANKNYLCTLQGTWTGWNFKFIKDQQEMASVSKKWAGLGKEFFTSADNYVLQINPNVPENDKIRLLIFAAVMCIDMVLKE